MVLALQSQSRKRAVLRGMGQGKHGLATLPRQSNQTVGASLEGRTHSPHCSAHGMGPLGAQRRYLGAVTDAEMIDEFSSRWERELHGRGFGFSAALGSGDLLVTMPPWPPTPGGGACAGKVWTVAQHEDLPACIAAADEWLTDWVQDNCPDN